ncbi:MAG: HDOD domain-containing protein [Steroidobacteraceae bacterium]|nr:HDOD domain-containing protein [Steroidobacteraceae bacterium]MDW8258184.1 HDOD domain-containing protein [Gammaproteobacteria bacterium]
MSNVSALRTQPDNAAFALLQAAHDAAERVQRQLPLAPPPALAAFVADDAPLAADWLSAGDGRLLVRALRATLFNVRGHGRSCELLWRSSAAAAVYAVRIAQLRGIAQRPVAVTALLHRSGKAIALGVLAQIEAAHKRSLDPVTVHRFVAQHEQGMAEALARDWRLPADIAAAMRDWRSGGAAEPIVTAAAAVYYGQLLALAIVDESISAPGARLADLPLGELLNSRQADTALLHSLS